VEAVASSVSWAPAAASSSPAAAPSSGIATNGNQWAMTYTPYTTTGACKAASDVMTDVASIKAAGFTTLRMYGTDCSGLQNVGAAARAAGLKMIIGIFIEASGISGAESQVTDITTWGSAGNWDLVIMIVVGNEAISSGYCDAPSLAGFISSSKAAFQAAGSGSIPVTTTEPVNIIVEYASTLCPVCDVAAANIQTFFDGGVVAANAGDFATSQLQQVETACPGKPAYNLESGWPSAGGDNGASLANPTAQQAAISDIVAKLGDKSVIFSFSDDAWKPAGVQQHFGCLQLF
jgi:exo-beta-1,3-glucanase (GH17 family)